MKTYKTLFLFIIALLGIVAIYFFQIKNGFGTTMPLTIKNSWTYQIDCNALDSLIPCDKDTWTITSDSIISGERWYCMQDRGWFTNRSDGVYLWLRGRHDPGLFISYPSKIGATFRNSYGDSTVLVADGIRVKVEAGEFRCCLYKSFQSPYRYIHGVRHIADSSLADIYFAPGVGMVRLDLFNIIGSKNVIRKQQRLVEYKKY
jgi:hypothetical protein